ncbi:MAG: GNAT family N-acetyltransferase [Hydrococcus sp. Prado102]|jgi:RimJ/RimL family protein N-acetyltransferase|nr:GNAT family N-acetyltransferase [Hydrococcus sp. Prado102]
MATLFETERLIVRNWIPQEDAAQAFEIYGDREVMRYISDGKTAESVEAVRDRLQERISSSQKLNNGTGFWAVVNKNDRQIVGVILLKQLPDNDGIPTKDIEIGWHFRRSYWGHGYATEAARGIVTYGFDILKLPVLYAVAKPENERSIRVMQRLGMKSMGRINKYYGVELLLFQLNAYA